MELKKWEIGKFKNQDLTPSTSLLLTGLKPLGYEIINLGSDEPVVLTEAIHMIENLVGKKAKIEYLPRHPADVSATWADIGRAEKLLGWSPRISFEEGIKNLVYWYTENRNWAKNVDTDI